MLRLRETVEKETLVNLSSTCTYNIQPLAHVPGRPCGKDGVARVTFSDESESIVYCDSHWEQVKDIKVVKDALVEAISG